MTARWLIINSFPDQFTSRIKILILFSITSLNDSFLHSPLLSQILSLICRNLLRVVNLTISLTLLFCHMNLILGPKSLLSLHQYILFLPSQWLYSFPLLLLTGPQPPETLPAFVTK